MASKEKDNKKKKNTGATTTKIRKSVQQSIPYSTVFPNGIIMCGQGNYSKSYKLEDANFQTADQSAQENMYLDYEGLLNSIGPNQSMQITVFNRSISPEAIRNQVLLKPKADNLNGYRDIYNEILLDKISEGRNNLRKEKYLTISTKASNIEDAATQFNRIDSEVNSKVSRINKTTTPPMTIEDRLGVFYDIYNEAPDFPFSKKISPLLRNEKLDFKALNGSGLTSKDLIGPESMYFQSNYFKIGEMFARAMYMDNLPTFMNANVLTDLTDLPCNMLTSVNYVPIAGDKAADMVKHQFTNIKANIAEAQKRASKGGYSGELLPSELQRAKEEAENLLNDMQSRNQKLFRTNVVIVIFAESKEELDQLTESVKSIGVTYLAQIKVLAFQQEAGLHSALPLADMDIKIDRVLNTEASAVFMPFSVKELSQTTGIYYGQNAISKNVIMYDRLNGDNYNGLIFGKPGSGKSFIAKSEMLSVILGTNDDLFVIDPEGEYTPLVEAFGGQVIKISLNSETHINPLDMDVQYAGAGEDPIAMKCDFLVSICEAIVGHGNLSPVMVNLIHRCGRRIYKPYYDHMQEVVKTVDEETGRRITCDRRAMPTLVDFYQELVSQPDSTAQLLASALEMYCIGNYDLFAKQTNINPESRFIVYDIKDIAAGTKELALSICLNDIWNRIIENKKKGKRTWFYIDEFYLLLQTKSSAQFLMQIYKRARKWGGIPTGITQNVSDLLSNEDAKTILNNCNFLLMMNQSQIDRAELSDIFGISESLQDYITDKPAGTGLLYTGSTIVPIENQFPKGNELYKIMSTKVTEKDSDEDDTKLGFVL